jgi:hypothetical protein
VRKAFPTRWRPERGSCSAAQRTRACAPREAASGTPRLCLWRRRYRSAGPARLRTGRVRAAPPRQIAPAKEQAVISATLRKPRAAIHLSAPRLNHEHNSGLTASQK